MLRMVGNPHQWRAAIDLTALIRGDDCFLHVSGCETRYASIGEAKDRSPQMWEAEDSPPPEKNRLTPDLLGINWIMLI